MEVWRIAYGIDALQFGDLRVPARPGQHAVALVIHGGFWRAKYDLEYIRPFCEALTEAGVATWNLEYRRLGNPGGGCPGTFKDVATGCDHLRALASQFQLDLRRTIAVGHSAGGHLALWLASQKKVAAVVALAPVADLRRAWDLRLSDNVVEEFLGGSPARVPARYRFGNPIERLPFGIPQRVIHGTADESVPYELSRRYVERGKAAGDDVELITLENSDHFRLVQPGTKEFQTVSETLLELAVR